jgi:polyadenylate-binding protein
VLHPIAAEKALTTLHGRSIPFVNPPAQLYLSAFPPSNPPYLPPAPQAQPRLVKQLPAQFTDSSLYDLFRPYGPMASVRANQAGFGDGTGVVEFYLEEDARTAEAALHCAEVGDSNIAVQVYQQRRAGGNASEFGVNPNATSFVPVGGSIVPYHGTQVITMHFDLAQVLAYVAAVFSPPPIRICQCSSVTSICSWARAASPVCTHAWTWIY